MRKTTEFGTVTTDIQRLKNNYDQDLLNGSTGEVKAVKTKEDLVNCFVLPSKWDLRETTGLRIRVSEALEVAT